MIGKGQSLPDDDHVMRYVSWAKLLRDEDDNVLGFLPQAFELKPDEESLSVNWLEVFGGDHESNKKQAVKAFRASSLTIGKKSGFGIANVRLIKEICKSSGALVRIVYAPEPGNLAHSLIHKIPRNEFALLEALASEAFTELLLNSAVSG